MTIHYLGGLPRAGSTLIMNILGQNKKFTATPTSGVLEMIYGMRRSFSASPEFKAQGMDNMKPQFYSSMRGCLEGWYQGHKVVIDKNRGWLAFYELLKKMYPEPKVIVPVRDIRGCLLSMEKIWRKNPEIQDPMENQLEMKFVTVQSRVEHWLNNLPLGLAIERLGDTIRRGNGDSFLFVRMEDLVDNPENEIKRIYEYIGEEYYEHQFSKIKQITHENDDFHSIYGDHKIKPTIEPVSNNWEEVLGRDICDMVLKRYDWYYQIFYPEQRKKAIF
ncbi:MAG: sulfotransferase [Spirochaetota bacterium]|nr:sulfotransferase [Spirochaetota bacterium]